MEATPQPAALELAGGAASLQPAAARACVKPIQGLRAPSRFRTPAGKRKALRPVKISTFFFFIFIFLFFILSNQMEREAGLPLETVSYYYHCVIKDLQDRLVICTCMTPTTTRAQVN